MSIRKIQFVANEKDFQYISEIKFIVRYNKSNNNIMKLMQTTKFTLKDLKSIMDTAAGTPQDSIESHMIKCYPLSRKEGSSVYVPLWYIFIPTGATITHDKNDKKIRHVRKGTSFLVTYPKKKKMFEVEVMVTDNASDGYWSLAYLEVSSDGKILFGASELLVGREREGRRGPVVC